MYWGLQCFPVLCSLFISSYCIAAVLCAVIGQLPTYFSKSSAVFQIDITAGPGLLNLLMQEARKEHSSYSLDLPETKSALNGSSCKSR